MNAEIVGPFQEYRLVVDGFRVPLIEAQEQDGGKVMFVLDQRFAVTVPTAQFEDVAWFLANVVAVASGVSCFPNADDDPSDVLEKWRGVHAALRPSRMHGIDFVNPEASA